MHLVKTTSVLTLAFLCAGFVTTCDAQSGTRSRQATPDTYFKVLGNQDKGSQTRGPYSPPDFTSGSGNKSAPVNASSESVSWGSSRSILRDDPKAQDRVEATPVQQQQNHNVKTTVLQPFEPSRVVAIVGGEPVFVGDMLFEANQIIEKHLPNAPEKAKEVQRKLLLSKLVNKYVDQALLYVDALSSLPDGADLGAFLEQAESVFDDKVLPGMIESSGVSSVTDFDANLRVQGTSLRQVRRAWAKDQLARNFMGDKLNVNQSVTHHEMFQIYNENRESYHRKAKARWEQVMIRFDRCDSKEDAKKQIVELGNQVVYGANFEAVAKKSSHGFRADEGGQHDWTSKNALVLKKLDEAIFSLPIGRLSDIIESRDGYHIIRIKERNDEGYVPFTEAQIKIREKLKADRQNEAFKKHLEKIRAEIPVEHFPLNSDQ